MRLTLDDLRGMTRDIITPAMAAGVLECDPHFIRIAARDCPDALGFPVARIGSRTKIPRLAFIAWCEGGADSVAFVHVPGAEVPLWKGRAQPEGGGEA